MVQNIIENGKKFIPSVQEKHSTNLGAKFVSAIAVVHIKERQMFVVTVQALHMWPGKRIWKKQSQ